MLTLRFCSLLFYTLSPIVPVIYYPAPSVTAVSTLCSLLRHLFCEVAVSNHSFLFFCFLCIKGPLGLDGKPVSICIQLWVGAGGHEHVCNWVEESVNNKDCRIHVLYWTELQKLSGSMEDSLDGRLYLSQLLYIWDIKERFVRKPAMWRAPPTKIISSILYTNCDDKKVLHSEKLWQKACLAC